MMFCRILLKVDWLVAFYIAKRCLVIYQAALGTTAIKGKS